MNMPSAVRSMVHVVVDEGTALLNEPYHHERHVLHQPVRHRDTKCREPSRPGLGPHGRLAVGVGAEGVAVEAIAGIFLQPSRIYSSLQREQLTNRGVGGIFMLSHHPRHAGVSGDDHLGGPVGVRLGAAAHRLLHVPVSTWARMMGPPCHSNIFHGLRSGDPSPVT